MRTFDLDQYWPAVSPVAPSRSAFRERLLSHIRQDTGPLQEPFDASMAAETSSGAAQPASSPVMYEPPVVRTPQPEVRPLRGTAAKIPSPGDRASPVLWGGLGFVAGILAWHLLGFWTFVAKVVNDPPTASERVAIARPERRLQELPALQNAGPPKANAQLTTGSLQPSTAVLFSLDPKNCQSLVLDRQTGQTRLEPCPENTRTMRDAGRQRRGDLAANRARNLDSAAWAQGTAIGVSTENGGTLLPGDFDLAITPPRP
jgi:hypothetical protein